MTLDEIKQEMVADDLPLKNQAKQIVFGHGNKQADILFIGEAPGATEDKLGLPFVGRAGKLLDTLLEHIDLDRKDIYITNVVKYRPPKNRNPNMREIRAHTPYLVRQIQALDPKVIVPMGNFSTKFVLAGFEPKNMKNIDGISTVRGRKYDVSVDGGTYTVFPVYHPAAALYNPNLKSVLKKDFESIRKLTQEM